VNGHVFLAAGDITQFAAHAIAYSASTRFGAAGNLYPAFRDNVPGFAEWFDSLGDRHAGRVNVGDTFWMPTGSDPAARPLGVVVVVATGGPATEQDKAGIAVRAALVTAVDRIRGETGTAERLLIGLPAFRVGLGGDRDHRLRSARVQIRAALEVLGEHPRVDAAFLAYTPAIYHTFLEARRQVLGDLAPVPSHPPELEHSLLAGECVLFAGAGLSRGAGLPGWANSSPTWPATSGSRSASVRTTSTWPSGTASGSGRRRWPASSAAASATPPSPPGRRWRTTC
jgi:hypothetical protein